MRRKFIALTAIAVLIAVGVGVGAAFVRHTGQPVEKNVPPDKENLRTFVQTANEWLAERQKTAGLSFYMADAENGWRTDGKNVYYTSDSGKTWTAAAPFYDGGAVDFVDSTHAVALAKAVKNEEMLTGISVYATADSGKVWRHLALAGAPYFSADNSTRGVDGFSMTDSRNGLLMLAGDAAAGHHESSVFSTKDGARSFQQQTDNLRVPNGQTTLVTADATHAYLFVNGSASPVFMTATADGGKTWTEQDNGVTAHFTDVTPSYMPVRMTGDTRIALLSVQNGVEAAAAKGQTEKADTHMRNTFYTLSANGAVSGKLAELLTELPLDAKSVSMPDAQTIFVFSHAQGKPVLYRHVAQGGWTRIVSNTLPSDASQIQFLNLSNGFILQKDAVYVTVDGGKSWMKSVFSENAAH
ncbi:MAG: hypothetical protein ABF449_04025 [Ethanoligenens sp.]|uniref:WD40/YVTN/BNR-like repeat-containing protein n=1 Tax=Ethanoligenens sp. TaxID=2099655 RepID=UPI0039E8063E